MQESPKLPDLSLDPEFIAAPDNEPTPHGEMPWEGETITILGLDYKVKRVMSRNRLMIKLV